MVIYDIINFLETDIVSVTFSDIGLKYLSLKPGRGAQNIHLGSINGTKKLKPRVQLFIKETQKFLETGRHNMPLDLTGFTDFQRRVFGVVSNIEPGEITTYKGVAELLGNPKAARAVGSAVTKNPVSYFIPTHRVLPRKGIGVCRSGAGFLREKLLEHEGHDVSRLRGNYVCNRKRCCME